MKTISTNEGKNAAMSDRTAIPLSFSPQGKGRIVVGLSWDPRADKVRLIDRIARGDSQHDMDLVCYVYNAEGECIDFIGAEAQDSMSESGHIYHSGDDMTGEGGGDDETITAELSVLPDDIDALVFLAEIKSNHVFADIESPSARLFDSLTHEIILESWLGQDAADKNKIACVLWALRRDDVSETGWTLHVVQTCPDVTDITEWGAYLARYIG